MMNSSRNAANALSSIILPPVLVVQKLRAQEDVEMQDSQQDTKMYEHKNKDDNLIECSVHNLPKSLLREFRHVFNEEYLNLGSGQAMAVDTTNDNDKKVLLAIPTNQRALVDLVAVGDEIEQEKDRLLNVFLDFATEFCDKVRKLGYWADYIDPCSGLPMLTMNCNKVYSEVDGMGVLLNYKSYNAGFCKILVHPKFGSSVYPATIFAHAPSKLVVQILQQYPKHQ